MDIPSTNTTEDISVRRIYAALLFHVEVNGESSLDPRDLELFQTLQALFDPEEANPSAYSDEA